MMKVKVLVLSFLDFHIFIILIIFRVVRKNLIVWTLCGKTFCEKNMKSYL